jgi:hypothetical protein
MEKSIQGLVSKLGQNADGKLTGGFANIKGGLALKKRLDNDGAICSNNTMSCQGNNSNCNNSAICDLGSNTHCSNTGACFH